MFYLQHVVLSNSKSVEYSCNANPFQITFTDGEKTCQLVSGCLSIPD